MRAGGCTLQQGLTAEAASVVKQAVTLARHRGHAQVTPLHVANTMLAVSTGLLRTACLQSHSHPLQCKALELCFNVALNRLPASNSSPMLGNHHHHHGTQHPSISNALIAAFKRAQAHQRRGSIENQQQPLLAVKIELEQLIISILDDPSVSRVMREAGFSSTQVKSNIEQAVSLEICSQSTSTTPNSVSSNNSKSKESNLLVVNGSKIGKPAAVSLDLVRNEDVVSVIEGLVSKKRRSVVIVGESIGNIEGVVRGVMDKVEKNQLDVPHEGLRGVKFISFTLSSFGNSSRAEVEQKFVELKNLLRSCMAKGVILYLGDLKWVSEYRASVNSSGEHGRGYSYFPVEHMIMEIGKLVCGIGDNESFWLMGIATFQTYMRCKSGQPSLETIWGIHPLTIPEGSLRLSLLTTDSDLKSDESTTKNNGTSKSLIVDHDRGNEDKYELTCCAECSAKFEAEAKSLQNNTNNSNSTTHSTTSNLPAWLQQCRTEACELRSNNENCVPVAELCRKWNSFCYSTHQHQLNTFNYSSSEKNPITFSFVSPSSSASGFSYDHHHHQQNPNYQSCRDHSFWVSSETPNKSTISTIIEPSLGMYFTENKENSSKQPMLISSNPNSTPTSASSSDVMEAEYSHKFKELNSENLKTLCNALEKKVPWQKDIITEIASTILKCRSGMVRRKGKMGFNVSSTSNTHDRNNINHPKEETWLFFQGVDTQAKERIAKELAKLVFGSTNDFVPITLSSFSSTRADSTEDYGGNNANKRSRDEQSCSYIERFGEAVSLNPHRVFLVEDVEQADYFSQMGFKRAIERGRVMNSSGEEVELRDAIVILSCESFSSRSRACSPSSKQKIESDQPKDHDHDDDHDHDHHVVEETCPCVPLDLNVSFDDQMDDQNGSAYEDDDQSIDDIGLLESVDRRIIFRIQEVL